MQKKREANEGKGGNTSVRAHGLVVGEELSTAIYGGQSEGQLSLVNNGAVAPQDNCAVVAGHRRAGLLAVAYDLGVVAHGGGEARRCPRQGEQQQRQREGHQRAPKPAITGVG